MGRPQVAGRHTQHAISLKTQVKLLITTPYPKAKKNLCAGLSLKKKRQSRKPGRAVVITPNKPRNLTENSNTRPSGKLITRPSPLRFFPRQNRGTLQSVEQVTHENQNREASRRQGTPQRQASQPNTKRHQFSAMNSIRPSKKPNTHTERDRERHK